MQSHFFLGKTGDRKIVAWDRLGTGLPSALLVIRSRRRSRQPVSAVASRVLLFVDNDGAASRPSRLFFGPASRSPPSRRQRLGLRWQAVFRATPLFPASPRILFACPQSLSASFSTPIPIPTPTPNLSAFLCLSLSANVHTDGFGDPSARRRIPSCVGLAVRYPTTPNSTMRVMIAATHAATIEADFDWNI